MKVRLLQCATNGSSTRAQWRSAAWLVGGSLVLTVLGIVLRQAIGPNAFSEGLLYSAFPASLMLSNECTYFRRYSPPARFTLAIGGALFIVLLVWASVAVGNRI